SSKFDIECTADEFKDMESPDVVSEYLKDRARELYRQRESRYPVDFVMDLTTNMMQQDARRALDQFTKWTRHRYELDWEPEKLPSTNPMVLRDILYAEAEKWDEAAIRDRARRALPHATDRESFDAWSREHVGVTMPEHFAELFETDREQALFDFFTEVLRIEMLQFERWILLQIVDGAWKDHLHSMDQLREAIGYRSFSQLDPRIEYKREGAKLFEDMHEEVRDRVTDLIFKARLQPQVAPPQPAPDPAGVPEQPAATGTTQQRRTIEAAQQAGPPEPRQAPRSNRPANASATRGRNEMVTVLDPKTGKKETMKFKKAKPLIQQGWRLVDG
ncbi:MAG: hypothetical protein CMJ41_09345, partial [Phycisphaerae bacterium]|nr:hypothetical protein [Phycisphaerae bacterium]